MNQHTLSTTPSGSSQTIQVFHPVQNSGSSNPKRTRITRACKVK